MDGRVAQMGVSCASKILSCKPLSMQVQLQLETICSDMFVNGLAITYRPQMFHRAHTYLRAQMHMLAFLHRNSPCHYCIWGKGALGSMCSSHE